MSCREYSENLTAYLDKELEPAEKQEIESHLGACSSCMAEFRSLDAAATFVDSQLKVLEPSAGIWTTLEGRIRDLPPPERRSRFPFHWPGWVAATAGLVAAFGLGLGIWTYRQAANEAELEQYMGKYVESREIEEEADRVSIKPAVHLVHDEYLDNPFSAVSDEPAPFRRED